MKYKAGERLQILRKLTGLTREEFATLAGLDQNRVKNIEGLRCRVSEEEFESVGKHFPELLHFVTHEGDIVVEELRQSKSELVRLIAAKIDARQLPKGADISDKLK